ncbi:MAG TPA: VOC family protein [Acidimicrobiia bacterium]|nr:VOC family protein [Acidimicrobiia bacterium]
MSTGFRIGKLFHLTPLVESLADAELFFDSVFSPHCMMRNYSPHWNRDAAIYIIGGASIEPMECYGPREGEAQGSSWYRYVQKNGPRVHNTAFYVENPDALAARFAEVGVRTTDGGAPGTVFAHPKDTPGMLEFSTDTYWRNVDPRFSPHWEAFAADFWSRHPLGVQRMSHITTVVHDAEAAQKFFVDVLEAVALPTQPATIDSVEATYVLVGDDTVMELAQPRDTSSTLAATLDTVGQVVTGVTFTVSDVERAGTFLDRTPASVLTTSDHDIVIDPASTWNTEFRFTDRELVGDPRIV